MDMYERALQKIRNDEKYRNNFCNIILTIPPGPTGSTPGSTGPTGPTGPTGASGPTSTP